MKSQSDSHTAGLFQGTRGPRDARIVLVGEAWGEEEARQGRPFVGTSGWILDKVLVEAGVPPDSVLMTNVVSQRPKGNDFNEFLVPNKGSTNADLLFGIPAGPALRDGVTRLGQLISACNPSLVVAAGAWPLWALSTHATVKTVKGYSHPSGIANWRGSQTHTREVFGSRPLLPIYHPAAIAREWKLRAVTVHDLRARAARFLKNPATWKPLSQSIQHKPTYGEVVDVLATIEAVGGRLAVDIETYRRRWISCVGLAWSKREAICLPFFSFDPGGAYRPYWTPEQEQDIWLRLRRILQDPTIRIIGQNFGYDTQFFHRWYDIHALCAFDTMVAHHLLYPGTPKGLDDLASLYCDHYCFWKKESQDWDTKEFGAEAHWLYNAKDCLYTYEVAEALREVLAAEGMTGLFDFQMQQWRLAREMTLRGVAYDTDYIAELRKHLAADAAETAAWLAQAVPFEITGGTPWYNSPAQMMDLFYQRLGLPIKKHKKTKQPTIDDSALVEIEEKNPWLSGLTQRVRHLRSVRVFTSHFIDARPSADGRLHCQFNPAHPETFRWSSSATGFGEGTNLQNVPKPVED